MKSFSNWSEIDFKPRRECLFYKTIAGKNMQMFYIKMQPGQVTNHKHVEEQMRYILAGQVELTVGDEKKSAEICNTFQPSHNLQLGATLGTTIMGSLIKSMHLQRAELAICSRRLHQFDFTNLKNK